MGFSRSIFPNKNIDTFIKINFRILEYCKVFQFNLRDIQYKHLL